MQMRKREICLQKCAPDSSFDVHHNQKKMRYIDESNKCPITSANESNGWKNSEENREHVMIDDKKVTFLLDNTSNRKFTLGEFLGEGTFARCYTMIDAQSGEIFAGKLIQKKKLTTDRSLTLVKREIRLHCGLDHPHIVKMYHSFEDNDNFCLLLQLCANQTLEHLVKRRKTINELDASILLYQIAAACEFLHGRKIIHRDLKPENLFLSDTMQIKVGDFGLAIMLQNFDEHVNRVCGTINYMAPEILNKKAYSFKVDIWAIGCILFTMLVGKPPFEVDKKEDIIPRIKANDLVIPSTVSDDAGTLITRLLDSDPSCRPIAQDITKFAFFNSNETTNALSVEINHKNT